MRTRPMMAALALSLAALGLTACGSDAPASSDSETTDRAAEAGTFNDADVTFLQSMIPHHEQAIEMAEMALDPATSAGPQVTALAKRIEAAQDPEITQMRAWLTAWGKPLQMDTSDGHDMSAMDGMMSDTEMKALGAATGTAFDDLWLQMMVEHHEGAITMAKTVKSEGTDPDVARLADEVIDAQEGEIAEMTALLKK